MLPVTLSLQLIATCSIPGNLIDNSGGLPLDLDPNQSSYSQAWCTNIKWMTWQEYFATEIKDTAFITNNTYSAVDLTQYIPSMEFGFYSVGGMLAAVFIARVISKFLKDITRK